jgi:hypothetical protein
MKAVSKGKKFKTIVEAPPGATKDELEKKANKYIKGKHEIKTENKGPKAKDPQKR